MNSDQTILLLCKLAFGSVATFTAILLWSKTRDTAWLFVILCAIISFGEIVFHTLKVFGIVKADLLLIGQVSVFELVLSNLPFFFLSLAFIIMVARKTGR